MRVSCEPARRLALAQLSVPSQCPVSYKRSTMDTWAYQSSY